MNPLSLPNIEERHKVSAELFRDEILPASQPVILRGLVKDWPAVREAQASPQLACEYLRRFDVGRPVPLLLGDPSMKRSPFYRDDMSGFNFQRQSVPLAAALQKLLAHLDDVDPPAVYIESAPLPDCLPAFASQQPLALLDAAVVPRIWIGNAIKIQTHCDMLSNIACVVAGQRRFTLFPPEQLPNLYIGPLDHTPAGPAVSMVSLYQPDFDRYPRFRTALANARVGELGPGDALYIPFAWWHHVESLASFNILVNYWWNDSRPALRPFNCLLYAVGAMRDLPDEQRAAWRNMFDYYVFKTAGEPMAHLAPEHRGLMGDLTPQRVEEIRKILMQSLRNP